MGPEASLTPRQAHLMLCICTTWVWVLRLSTPTHLPGGCGAQRDHPPLLTQAGKWSLTQTGQANLFGAAQRTPSLLLREELSCFLHLLTWVESSLTEVGRTQVEVLGGISLVPTLLLPVLVSLLSQGTADPRDG
jgi:hypothetical protein